MKGRMALALVAPAVLAAVVVTAAFATPQDPPGSIASSVLVARGATSDVAMHDKSEKLKLQAKGSLTVDIRNVTVIPNGSTGWHGHNGPSLVVVSSGSLTMLEPGGPAGSECVESTYAAGQAFAHPEGAHDFRAGSGGATFAIVYLLPEGASPAPIDVTPAPEACS